MRSPKPTPERGAALPMALVITLALVIIVSDFNLRARTAFDRSRRAVRLVESRGLLKKIESGLPALKPAELMALSREPREFPVDDFTVRLEVEPLETRLNVNRLNDLIVGGPVQELFGALLKREQFEHRALPCALDWVDADDEPRASGAERLDYLGEDISPRNGPFETVDELSFVRGFRDVSAFDRIRPLLTSYGSGKIYVPAASDEMLDLFEDAYGLVARNKLEDMRRYPGVTFQLPTGSIPAAALQSIQSILTDLPTAWRAIVIFNGAHLYVRREYVIEREAESGAAMVRRVA